MAILFCPAHWSMLLMSWPTRLGSAIPATTFTYTGLVCGQRVPAAGVVPSIAPICGLLATPTCLGVELTVRPAWRSAASAWATLSVAGMAGTLIIRGPLDTVSVIVAPGSAWPDGEVLITSPVRTVLLLT